MTTERLCGQANEPLCSHCGHYHHPHNAALLDRAISEMHAVSKRHFRGDLSLRVTIPAQNDDSDVLILSALHAARCFLEQKAALEGGAE